MYLISTLIAYIETYGFISCKVGHVEIQNATQKVLYNLIKSLVWSKKDQNRARNSLRVYVSVRKYCHNSYRRSIADTTCQDRCYRIGNCKDALNFCYTWVSYNLSIYLSQLFSSFSIANSTITFLQTCLNHNSKKL